MVSDQEIANGVESLLRQSGPNVFTSVNGVVQQLGAKLGLDLSHKAGFIQNQINLLLRRHPQPPPSKDHIILQHHPQSHQNQPLIPPHFALHHHRPEDLNFRYTPPQPQPQPQLQPQPQTKSQSQPQPQLPHPQPQPQPHQHPLPQQSASDFVQNVAAAATATAAAPEVPKESAPTGAKRRGASGGLNKVCGVSPELQTIVGEPAMPRTEIVKQLWAYIRKNNLQDPSNKRKIICDDALRLLFETDCTDMFKMNKLLSKHIIRLEPPKESVQDTKRLKVGTEFASESSETVASPIIISDALAKFFGTGEREMLQVEARRRVWEYIKANHLEDPSNSMVIMCDAKLQELLGCESISALGISEMLTHHLFKQS